MTRLLLLSLVALPSLPAQAAAQPQDLGWAIRLLEDRFNQRALHALLGHADYEFVYAPSSLEGPITFLEETALEEALGVKVAWLSMDPALLSTPARQALRRQGLRGITGQDTLTLDGSERLVVRLQEASPQPGAPPPLLLDTLELASWEDYLVGRGQQRLRGHLEEARSRRERLPADLRQADLQALTQRLRPPSGSAGRPLHLGVWAVVDPRDSGERLTLAESELTPLERRQWGWDMRQVYGHWPGGTHLYLEPEGMAQLPETVATLPVRWSFRRWGPPPAFAPEIFASGQVDLTFQKVEGVWKVSHVESLIAAVHQAVVP